MALNKLLLFFGVFFVLIAVIMSYFVDASDYTSFDFQCFGSQTGEPEEVSILDFTTVGFVMSTLDYIEGQEVTTCEIDTPLDDLVSDLGGGSISNLVADIIEQILAVMLLLTMGFIVLKVLPGGS